MIAASCAGDESIQPSIEHELIFGRQCGEERSASSVASWSLFGSPLDDSGADDFILGEDSLLLSTLPFRARSQCVLMSSVVLRMRWNAPEAERRNRELLASHR